MGNVLEGWEVIHTPGHTEGSVCFYNKEEKLVFTGDTLYCGDFGSIKSPDIDTRGLINSLLGLLRLEGDTVALPSWGTKTTIKDKQEAVMMALQERIKERMKEMQKKR